MEPTDKNTLTVAPESHTGDTADSHDELYGYAVLTRGEESPVGASIKAKLLCLGDSITQATNGHNSYRYPLSQLLTAADHEIDFVGTRTAPHAGSYPASGWDTDHEGYWGYRTDELLPVFETALQKLYDEANIPDILLIHAGTNDAIQDPGDGSLIDQAATNLVRLVHTARAFNPYVRVIISKLIPPRSDASWSQRHGAINQLIDGLPSTVSSAHSPVIVADPVTGFDPETMLYDGTHPSPAGEAHMAAAFASTIEAVWEIEPAPIPEPPDPTARYTFEAEDVTDEMGNHDGEVYGGATFMTEGDRKSLYMTGKSGASLGTWDPGTTFTLRAMDLVPSADTSSYKNIFNKRLGPGGEPDEAGFRFMFYLEQNSTEVRIWDAGGVLATGVFLTPGEKYDLVLTAQDGAEYQLMVNGTVAWKGRAPSLGPASDAPFQIGAINGSANGYGFKGRLGQAEIWQGVALTTEQIQLLHTRYLLDQRESPPAVNQGALAFALEFEPGALTADATGNTTFSAVNNPTANSSGKVGGCVEFNGTGRQHLVAADGPFTRTGDRSWEFAFLINADSFASAPYILNKPWDNTTFEYAVRFQNTGALLVQIGTQDQQQSFTTTGSIPAGSWQAVFVGFDREASVLEIGFNDAGTEQFAVTVPTEVCPADLVIGMKNPGANQFQLDGRLDQLFKFNRKLSASDRAWLYNAGAWRTAAEVVAWLEEGEQPTVLSGTGAVSDRTESTAAMGSLLLTGAGALTDSRESIDAAGTVGIYGSSVILDARETSAASGTVITPLPNTISGQGSTADNAECTRASGSVTLSGSGAQTDHEAESTIEARTGITGGAESADRPVHTHATGRLYVTANGALIDAAPDQEGSIMLRILGSGSARDLPERARGYQVYRKPEVITLSLRATHKITLSLSATNTLSPGA